MRIKTRVALFFNHLRKRLKLKPCHYLLSLDEDFPDEIETNCIYFIGTTKTQQYAIFQCPCGCGRVVELNLNPKSSPLWSVKWNVMGTVSFTPSIWRKSGCRSHFFFKHGQIIWCDPAFSSTNVEVEDMGE